MHTHARTHTHTHLLGLDEVADMALAVDAAAEEAHPRAEAAGTHSQKSLEHISIAHKSLESIFLLHIRARILKSQG